MVATPLPCLSDDPMTDTQRIIELLENLEWLVTTVAMAQAWIAGALGYRLFLFAKNHRDLW